MQDDDTPVRKPARLVPPVLDGFGVAEIEDYIAELKAEIARAEAAIGRKRAQRGVADSFFKS